MKVQAKELGYYEHKRRREGDVFTLLDPKDFSEKWMISLEEEKKEQKAAPVFAKDKSAKTKE